MKNLRIILRLSISFVLLFSVLCVFAQNRRSNSYRQQNGYRQGNTYNPRRGTTTGESILSRLQMQAQKEQGDVKQQSKKERKKKNKNASSDSPNLEKDDVVLVVTGEGVNKEEATKTALRSAIEQAYGTFVSANTSIVNDELVKDEIATIASGNIKSYKELASAVLPDGSSSITLSAVVSTGKLISYAQAHGGSVEFAGKAFAMEMKMRKLNKENETKILENLCVELKEVASTLYDFSVEVGTPKVRPSEDSSNETYILPVCLIAKPNSNYYTWIEYMKNVFSAISLSNHEKIELEQNGIKSYVFSFLGTMFLFRNKYNADDSCLKQCTDLLNSWKNNWEININKGWMVLRPKDNIEKTPQGDFIYPLLVFRGGGINGMNISVSCRPSLVEPIYDLSKYQNIHFQNTYIQKTEMGANEIGFCYVSTSGSYIDYYYRPDMGIENNAFYSLVKSRDMGRGERSLEAWHRAARKRLSEWDYLPYSNDHDYSWYITLDLPLTYQQIGNIKLIEANWKSE